MCRHLRKWLNSTLRRKPISLDRLWRAHTSREGDSSRVSITDLELCQVFSRCDNRSCCHETVTTFAEVWWVFHLEHNICHSFSEPLSLICAWRSGYTAAVLCGFQSNIALVRPKKNVSVSSSVRTCRAMSGDSAYVMWPVDAKTVFPSQFFQIHLSQITSHTSSCQRQNFSVIYGICFSELMCYN